MNRNILLAKKQNKKKQIEMLKKLKEQTVILKDQNIDPEKFNPDIPVKFQDDKNKRQKLIKPSNFKITSEKIIEKNTDIKKDYENLLKNRNEKLEIPNHNPKKRILGGLVGSYNDQKETIKEIKIETEKLKEEGKKANESILSFYE